MGTLGHVVPHHACGDSIRERERNDSSQFGEDGLIEAALERIGITNRWCFEVGAADGEFFSNTKRLRENGWNCVLIEADQERFGQLEKLATNQVRCVHEQIGPLSLDRILSVAGCPFEPDLGVIDIDGQDFWCWAGLRLYRPRLMLVEFWPTHDAEGTRFIPVLGGDNSQGQAALGPICDLGRAKGYEPILRTHCNVLFVKRELLWAT